MKKFVFALSLVVCLNLPAYALLGLGFGLHGGMTNGYSYDEIDNCLGEIADSLGINEELTFDEELTSIGAHVKIGTLPLPVDFWLFADYAWGKKEINDQVDFKLHDLSVGLSLKKSFDVMPIVKPYVGAGAAMHAMAYEFDTELTQSFPIPDNQSKIGYHFLGGVEVNVPMFPFVPYAEGRYNIIATDEKSTKFLLLEAGISLTF
ncbi:MAG: hypothetical protein J7K40_08940 [candidate division Zixibacteria bacterium]|nr:hypothetical protein [candidate division Zixibacteria bacterium]